MIHRLHDSGVHRLVRDNAPNIRDQLIRKGLIYASERGYVTFTVPGMDEFINRQ